MEALQNISIELTTGRTVSLRDYDGGYMWYEILGWIDENQTLSDDRIREMEDFLPSSIREVELSKTIRDSPLNTINHKKLFQEIESERLNAKDKKGNSTCKFCGSKAQSVIVQSRSADEASSVRVTCLDEGCKKIYIN